MEGKEWKEIKMRLEKKSAEILAGYLSPENEVPKDNDAIWKIQQIQEKEKKSKADEYLKQKIEQSSIYIENGKYVASDKCYELINSILKDYDEDKIEICLDEKYKPYHSIIPNPQYVSDEKHLELVEIILLECCYKRKLKLLLNQERQTMLSEEMYDDTKSGNFMEAFILLRTMWGNPSKGKLQQEEGIETLFKVIFEKHPQLCKEAFPTVLFIIANHYYDFCQCCNISETRSTTLPETLNTTQKKNVIEFFKDIINGDGITLYPFLLLESNSKNNLSPFKHAESIKNKFTSKCKNPPDSFEDKNIEDIQKKIIEKIEKANRNNICPNSSFHAIFNFIKKFSDESNPDNFWANYNVAFSVFCLNITTGWVSCILAKKSNEPVFQLNFLKLPFTLYLINFVLTDSWEKSYVDNDTSMSTFYRLVTKLWDCINDDEDIQAHNKEIIDKIGYIAVDYCCEIFECLDIFNLENIYPMFSELIMNSAD